MLDGERELGGGGMMSRVREGGKSEGVGRRGIVGGRMDGGSGCIEGV